MLYPISLIVLLGFLGSMASMASLGSVAQPNCELRLPSVGGTFVPERVGSGGAFFAVGRGIDEMERRAVVLFDLPRSAQNIEWAELRLFAGRVNSTNEAETLTLYEVATPSFLFEDLGDGTVFGNITVHPADGARAPNLTGAMLRTRLTQAGVNAVQGSAGKTWAIGLALSTLRSSGPEYVLKNGDAPFLQAELLLGTRSTADLSPPQIRPLAASPLVGDQLSLIGQFCASAPVLLQWSKDGVILAGETNEILTFSSLQGAHSGPYSLIAQNSAGSVTSTPLTLSVIPLELEPLPTDIEVVSPGTAVEVKSRSALPVSYQWRKDSTFIAGATDSRLPLSVRNGLTNGSFDVIVSNSAGSVTSSIVRVSLPVEAPPVSQDFIPTFYSDVAVNPTPLLGLIYDFSPPQWQAYPPPAFSWLKDGQALIPPETNSVIHFPVLGPEHAGVYQLIISNRLGTARSRPFTLHPIAFTIYGNDQYVWLGDSVVLQPFIEGLGPFSYGWEHDGKPVPAMTNSEFRIDFANAADNGRYTVRATNAFGSASASMTLQVQTNLSELTLGGDQTYLFGHRALLGGLYYLQPQTDKWRWQWLKDGHPLAGETNRTLVIERGAAGDNGIYRLQFTIGSQSFLTLPSQVRFIAQDVTFHDLPALELREKLGSYAILGTSAEAGPPPTYQWMKDGAIIPGAVEPSLAFKQLKSKDAGTYVLLARNETSEARYTNTLAFRSHQTLDRWAWRAPLPLGSVLWSIAFGNGRFVAGGRAGIIAQSTDGENWSATFLDPRLNVLSVEHSDGKFHVRAVIDPSFWLSGTRGKIDFAPGVTEFTSADGLIWELLRTVPVNFSSDQDEIYYQHNTATFQHHRYSAWGQTIVRLPEENQGSGVPVFSNTNGYLSGIRSRGDSLFAFVGNSTAAQNPYFYHSTDARTWEKQESPAWLTDVLFLGDILIATTTTDGQLAIRRPDHQWLLANTGTVQPIHALSFGKGRYVGVGGAGVVITSGDALNWLPLDSTQEIDLYGLAARPGLIVAAGESGTILTSADGHEWVSESSGTDRDLHDVGLGDGLLVAVGRKGTVTTSSTGDSWHLQSTSTKSDLSRTAYAHGTWITVGEDGVLLRSTNAVRWEKLDSNLLTLQPTAHEGVAYGQDLWVAVGGYFTELGGSAVSTIVYSRDDGRTWQSLKSTFGKRLRDVAYGAGYFVAVGNDGLILVSQDGLEWGLVQVDFANLRRVRLVGDRFVAVGNGGVAYSSTRPGDPSSWERHVLPTSQNVHNIAGASDGTVVALGNNGMILQSASEKSRFRELQSENGSIVASIESGMENGLDVEATSDFIAWPQVIEDPDNTFAIPQTSRRTFFRLRSRP